MTANELARVVVDAARHVDTKLGPGLLESCGHPPVRRCLIDHPG